MSSLDGLNVIETDQSLWEYTGNLRIHDDAQLEQLDEWGPVETWRVKGYTPHILLVHKCPFHDIHQGDEAAAEAKLRPAWVPFAVALNPEDEWSVSHWEPAHHHRPLLVGAPC